MEFIVLGLLMFQDMTIYQLHGSFKKGLELIYSASYGTLQYSVKKLLKGGFIRFREEVDNGRAKKIYSITRSGKERFLEWMYGETPMNRLEETALSKLYFLGLITEGGRKRAVIREITAQIEKARETLQEIENEVSALDLPPEQFAIARFQIKTLEYGIMSHSSAAGWFRDLLEELESEV